MIKVETDKLSANKLKMRKIHENLPHKNIFKLSIKTSVPGFTELMSITDRAVFEC